MIPASAVYREWDFCQKGEKGWFLSKELDLNEIDNTITECHICDVRLKHQIHLLPENHIKNMVNIIMLIILASQMLVKPKFWLYFYFWTHSLPIIVSQLAEFSQFSTFWLSARANPMLRSLGVIPEANMFKATIPHNSCLKLVFTALEQAALELRPPLSTG